MPATATIYTCVHLHAAGGSEAPLPHTTLHGAGADPIEGHALRDLVVALYTSPQVVPMEGVLGLALVVMPQAEITYGKAVGSSYYLHLGVYRGWYCTSFECVGV